MTGRSARTDRPHRGQAIALAKVLKDARGARKLSQQELAVRAGVSIGTVRAIEAKRSIDPSFFTVLSLADVLGLPIATLIEQARISAKDSR